MVKKLNIRSINKTDVFKKVMDQGNKSIFKSFIFFFHNKGSILNKAEKGKFQFHDIECHLGIIASKKVGKAVVRNKCKRRLRAAAKDAFFSSLLSNLGDYTMFGTLSVVLVARTHLIEENFAFLRDSIYKSLRYNFRLLKRPEVF